MRDASNLTGMTALVTGASSGIGLQFCYRLAERGAVIVMVSNQEEELRRCADEISERYKVCTFAVPMDLTESDSAERLLQFCDDNGLRVDMLINNAGIFAFDLLHNISESKIHRFIDLHVRSLTDMCYVFGERMKHRGTGYILNMSSMSCWMPMPGLAMYSSTKAYIRALSRSLHYELSDYGVSVTVACPGGIATDLFGLPENLKRLAVRIKAIDTPERFTRLALDKMLARKQQYINGLINRISIVMVGMTPKSVRMLVKHKLLDKNIRRP
jgi:short-subunit dehydrogenase